MKNYNKVKRRIHEADTVSTNRLMMIIESLEDAFHQSENRLRLIIDLVPHPIHAKERDGTIILANRCFTEQYNMTPDQVVGKLLKDIDPDKARVKKTMEYDREVIERQTIQLNLDDVFIDYHGRERFLQTSRVPFDNKGEASVLSVSIDITHQKQAEAELKKVRDQLEIRIKERTEELTGMNKALGEKTKNLEEANTALRVLLQNREGDRQSIEEKILLNIKALILPYLDKLENEVLISEQLNKINIIKYNLFSIASSFSKDLSSKYFGLTPAELKVANLIKQGMTSRKIAEILEKSLKTIEFHRDNIRKKLGIRNRKINLATYLMSLK